MTDFRRARASLTLSFFGLTVLVLVAVSVLVALAVRATEPAERERELVSQAEWLRGFLRSPQSEAEIREELEEIAVASEEPLGVLLYDDAGQAFFLFGTPTNGALRLADFVSHPADTPFPTSSDEVGPLLVVWSELDSPTARYAVLVSHLAGSRAMFRRLVLILAVVDAAAAALFALLGWLFAGAALGPVQRSYQRQRRFIADASHEMRTPLTAIIGEAEVTLRRPRSVEEYQGSMELCASYARQMAQVVESVLEMSRSDAGLPTMERRELDLAEIARQEGEAMSHRAAGGPEVVCEVPEAGVTIEGDPRQLRRVVRNLLANALQHSRSAREARVSVALDETRNEAVLVVSDDGDGIAEEHVGRIFERFYRSGSSAPASHDDGAGVGLGLAIVDSAVRAHNGSISVRTRPGEGATFTVRLPLTPSPPRRGPAP